MAAVTTVLSAGVALAGLGMNIAQQTKANKQQKQAQMAAQMAANKLKNVKEQNSMAGVTVPTLGYELAQQGMERQAMAGIEAAKGAGAEGVIGAIPGLVDASNMANLQLGAQLGEKQYERDVMQAGIGADIEMRRVEREAGIYSDEIAGAQKAAADAALAKQQAIQGMVGSTTELIGLGGNALHGYLMNNNENYRAKMYNRQPQQY
jgi:type II secretory pathway pseudopilin PulG